MANPQDDVATEYTNWCAKLAELSAGPTRPNYTLPGGASVDFTGYYNFLIAARDKARAAMLAANGPFTIISVAR